MTPRMTISGQYWQPQNISMSEQFKNIIPGPYHWDEVKSFFNKQSKEVQELIRKTGPYNLSNTNKGLQMEAEEFKKGDLVRYKFYTVDKKGSYFDYEDGIVTSTNDTYVFVRFKGFTSQGCKPDQLIKL